MTAPETFITRWVRLKRNADPRRATKDVTDTPTIPTPDLSAGTTEAAISQPRSEAATSDELFDPAGLPSIEAITANADIRGFLQSRVPAELTRAALRQAWASDPAIRDFIGIAENQWDFNDPSAIPGFGPLRDQDSAPALLAQAVGRSDRLAETIADMPLAAAEQSLPALTDPEPVDLGQSAQPTCDGSPATNTRRLREESSGEGAAVGDGTAGHESRQNRRSHGSALPR